MSHRGVSITTRLSKKTGVVTYEVRWREIIDGKKGHPSRSFTDQKEAYAFSRDVENRKGIVRQGRSLMGDSLKKTQFLTIAIPEYIQHLKNTKTTPDSKYWYISLRFLLRSIEKHRWTHTASIGRPELRMMEEDYPREYTRASAINTWKRFLEYSSEKYAVDDSYKEYFISVPESAESVAWTEDEREQLLAECQRPLPANYYIRTKRGSPEFKEKMKVRNDWRSRTCLFPIMWLMVHWAPRPVEACRLNVENYKPKSRTLHLYITKNRKPRHFVVDRITADILDSLTVNRSPRDPLFLSSQGKRWHPSGLSRLTRKILQQLEIPGTLYSARHHACTMLVALLHGEVGAVVKITGHMSMDEFQKYLHNIKPRDVAANAWDERRAEIGTLHPSITHSHPSESDVQSKGPLALPYTLKHTELVPLPKLPMLPGTLESDHTTLETSSTNENS